MSTRKFLSGILALPLLLGGFTPLALATTYYIDFTSGDNSAAGTSPATAWKHAPGDTNATGKPKAHALAPGDTLLFKGGVAYHGSIVIQSSGAEGKPIRLDGNLDGKYGKGPAILDGGKIIEGWTKCKNAEEAKGNPNWKNIFYADVDVDISKNFNHGEFVSHRKSPRDKMAPWQRLILCDGDKSTLPIAQLPKPKDNFYPDLPGDFYQSQHKLQVDKGKGTSVLTDPDNLKQTDANYYDGMQIGVHGGNNHVYFASIKSYSPETKQLTLPTFKPKLYPKAKYAIYNSVRLITEKGEWSVEPIEGGKSRFYFMPERLVGGKPDNIGFPILETCLRITGGASHIQVTGFLIQRYAGGKGAVYIGRNKPRSAHIEISNLEIRFLTGGAAIGPNYTDHLTIKNNYIHGCPGWTTAIFLSRVNDYELGNNLLVKNSGSGIRHYESKRGHIHNNAILDHYGMHSSTLNMYEGCEEILVENNYMHNVIAINRNAKKLTIRNNVVDNQNRKGIAIAIWGSGRVGGRNITDLVIENNTLINSTTTSSWGSTIFVQGKAPAPTGMVIRNNIITRLQGNIPANIENNIFMVKTAEKLMGTGGKMVSDAAALFQDPNKEDYRRKGDVLPKSGANLPAPSMVWTRKP